MKKNVIVEKIEKGFYRVTYKTGEVLGFISKINTHKWEFMFEGVWCEPANTMKECVAVFEKNYN